MSPISARRILKDFARNINPMRPDITPAEYDRRILRAVKIASALLAVLLGLSLVIQISH